MSGLRQVVVQEYSYDHWTNIHDILHTLPLHWNPVDHDEDISSATTKNDATSFNESYMYFLWGSERSGYMHPYLMRCPKNEVKHEVINSLGYSVGVAATQYSPRGDVTLPVSRSHSASVFQLPHCAHPPITGGGEWVVDAVLAIDDSAEGISWDVYFTANKESPTSKHLYRTHLLSASHVVEKITPDQSITPKKEGYISGGGWHEIAAVDISSGTYVDVFSTASSPPVTYLRRIDSHESADVVLFNPALFDRRYQELKTSFTAPLFDKFIGPSVLDVFPDQIISSSNRQMELASRELYCAAYIPDESVHGAGPYPIVVAVYGGPHVQLVLDKWSLDMRTQKLVQDGYLVVKCDNRGSSRRGISFEGALYRNMGIIEVCCVVNEHCNDQTAI